MQLRFLLFLQSYSTPWLDKLAQSLTILGEAYVLAVLFCAIYWCIDKETGRGILFALCASLCLNGILKDIFQSPRPIGEAGLFSLRTQTATGYSFPSGHSQSTAVFWSSLALWRKKPLLWGLAAVMMSLVGFSRMYLGLHYPVDVACGLLFGVLTALFFYLLLKNSRHRAAFACCGVLALVALLLWREPDTLAAAGLVAGLFGGHLLESRYACFTTKNMTAGRRVLRLVAGLALVGCVFLACKLLLPPSPWAEAAVFALVVFVGTGAYPVLFTRFGF